jgi:glycosyltransferase involved in cell wall biosynthesis
MPTAGGLTRTNFEEGVRNKIAVKGYENLWGKALFVLQVLEEISEEIGDLEVVFYGCSNSVISQAESVSRSSGLKIFAYGNGELSHSQVLELFRQSVMYIGHSLSDGISTSMLEAMSMGAIPIQTCTSCADEWIENNKTGFIVDPLDSVAIKQAILAIIHNEFDSDLARLENYKVIESRYDSKDLAKVALSYYESLTYKI